MSVTISTDMIKDNVKAILAELPDGINLVAAVEKRTPQEISQAIQAGVKIIGQNYINEAKQAYTSIDREAQWHFIGTMQKHNVRKTMVEMFDMIETVDSWEIAKEIDQRCAQINKVMPVLVEINSGREAQKSGVLPQNVAPLIKRLAFLKNLKVEGLMTMGPRFGDPEDSRPYFKETRRIFEQLKKLNLPNMEMEYLSMGMSNSYKIAIEEGANMVRIGTRIFGERDY